MAVIEVRPHRNGWIVERAIPFTVVATALCAVQSASRRDAATGFTRWIINPPGLASLFVRFAYLPDERHITGPRKTGIGIMDTDRVCAGHLDVHLVLQVDEHDVDPYIAIESTGDGRTARARGRRFQADPLEEGAGKMEQTHLTYPFITTRSAAAHDQHRSAGDRRNRCAVRKRRKVVCDVRC